jgi:hypothetical protein
MCKLSRTTVAPCGYVRQVFARRAAIKARLQRARAIWGQGGYGLPPQGPYGVPPGYGYPPPGYGYPGAGPGFDPRLAPQQAPQAPQAPQADDGYGYEPQAGSEQ